MLCAIGDEIEYDEDKNNDSLQVQQYASPIPSFNSW